MPATIQIIIMLQKISSGIDIHFFLYCISIQKPHMTVVKQWFLFQRRVIFANNNFLCPCLLYLLRCTPCRASQSDALSFFEA